MKRQFDGIFPALITPYDNSGKIDAATLKQVIERCLSQGVDGFYVGGSTGESLLLSEDERKFVLEETMNIVHGRAKVIAQIGCISTCKSIELAQHAKVCGADAVSSIPPIYFNFSADEISQYYFDLADNVDIPLLLYHVPALSGVNMGKETFLNLLAHPNIAGVKYTSFNGYELQRLISACPEKAFISGHDEIFTSNYLLGCRAAIGSTFNVMADKFVAMKNLLDGGKLQEALEIQNCVNAVIETMSRHGIFQSVKEALRLLGIGNGQCRPPFKPLSSQASDEIREQLRRAGYEINGI